MRLMSNSSFNALDGNPFSVFEPEEEDDNGDVDDVSVSSGNSADDPDSFGLFTQDHNFTDRYCRVLKKTMNSSSPFRQASLKMCMSKAIA